jgi:hypothetical protein
MGSIKTVMPAWPAMSEARRRFSTKTRSAASSASGRHDARHAVDGRGADRLAVGDRLLDRLAELGLAAGQGGEPDSPSRPTAVLSPSIATLLRRSAARISAAGVP